VLLLPQSCGGVEMDTDGHCWKVLQPKAGRSVGLIVVLKMVLGSGLNVMQPIVCCFVAMMTEFVFEGAAAFTIQ